MIAFLSAALVLIGAAIHVANEVSPR